MEVYERLEQEFGRWAGVEDVVGCSSGTAALHLALEALRLHPGSEVIVPDFTMIACARAVSLAGLTPVFVDCREDLLLDPALVERAVTDDTAAVMAVHVYGRCCDRPALYRVCQRHHLYLIEDAAEAHGLSAYPWSDAVAFSFYANKIIAGSEGGAVAFRDPAHAALARRLRCLGFGPEHDFTHLPRGHNYRLSNAHAGLILDSLRRVQANLCERRRIELAYLAHTPPEWLMPPRDRVWVFDVKVPGMTREQQGHVVAALREAGIAARHSFLPMHMQEEYRDCRRVGGQVAERMSDQVFYLPAVPGVTTPDDCRRAFDVIHAALPR